MIKDLSRLKSLAIIILLASFYSCNNSTSDEPFKIDGSIDTTNYQSIIINPDTTLTDKDHITTKDIFDSVKFIRLETNDESRFGFITQLEVTDQFYIVFDKVTKCILFFNKDGTYAHKIKDVTTGYFVVDKQKNEISFRDYSSATDWKFYSLTGKLVEIRKIPFQFSSYAFLDSNTIVFYKNYSFDKYSLAKISDQINLSNLVIKKDNKYEGHFIFDTTQVSYKDMVATNKPFLATNNKLLYSQPFNFNIFEISGNKILLTYKFILPKNHIIPSDFLNKQEYFGERLKYLIGNKDLIYAITDIYKIKNNLFFRLAKWSSPQLYHYNFSTKKLIHFNKVASKKDASLMPLGESYLTADSNALYTTITSGEILERKFFLGNYLKENQYPIVLQKFFKEGNNADNPFIIQMFPK
jgi:hypothetical protein